MVDTLHFIAVAAFLFWCLVSALCQLFASENDEARLVWWGGYDPAMAWPSDEAHQDRRVG
jgi:hypothetical protein